MALLLSSQLHTAENILKNQPFNTFFALAVIHQQVAGKAYADNGDNPKSLLALHPYGMALLWGDAQNKTFNREVREILAAAPSDTLRHRWVQTYPDNWNNLFAELQEERGHLHFERFTRSNFEFDPLKYRQWRAANPQSSKETIVKTSETIFDDMPGAVVPKYFWKTAADFIREGAGFTVLREGKPVATAFSAYCYESFLEFGIETVPEYYGQGLAQQCCAALIDYCLERDLTPVWSCRKENSASHMLAQKLGFIPTTELPNNKISYC